jgi:hypothetical protein
MIMNRDAPPISRRRFTGAALAATAGLGMTTAGRSLARAETADVAMRAVTTGPMHHFVGYYDKCPWNATMRLLAVHRASFCDRQPVPGEAVEIGLIDLRDGNRLRVVDRTTAWSWQQGAMLQWLGSAPDREIIYNTFDGSDYRATIRDVETGATRTLPRPIYALSPDGRQAVSLPFDRLNRLRPGYGYMARPERLESVPVAAPTDDGVWWMDTTTGEHRLIVPIATLAALRPDQRFEGAEHWVNHLQFSPGGRRITFLHRWKKAADTGFTTRMLVARPDGSDLRVVWDHGMVSHFDWRDDRTMLAWARGADGRNRFWLKDVVTDEASVLGEGVLTADGHCSYAPDRRWLLDDTYPNRSDRNKQTLVLFRVADGARIDIGRYESMAAIIGKPYRCDLHPRWARDGRQVCIDSTHEGGRRQVFVADVSAIVGA